MDIAKKYLKFALSSYKDVYSTFSYYNTTKINKDNVFVRIHKPLDLNDEVIVSIRGTDELKDWYNNILRWQTGYILNSNVHTGFLEHMNEVYSDIEKHIEEYDNITIVGHSLGGAVSLLLGAKIAHKNNDKTCKVITYGCPRAGDKNFKKIYTDLTNLKCYRVYINQDIITKIPYFGYYHIGSPIRIINTKYRCSQLKTVHSIDTYKELLDELDL